MFIPQRKGERGKTGNTETHKLLHHICYDKKVILISATPINNYSSDIENQLYLFQERHNSTILLNNKNLEGYFRGLRGKLNKLPKGTKEYREQYRKNKEQRHLYRIYSRLAVIKIFIMIFYNRCFMKH